MLLKPSCCQGLEGLPALCVAFKLSFLMHVHLCCLGARPSMDAWWGPWGHFSGAYSVQKLVWSSVTDSSAAPWALFVFCCRLLTQHATVVEPACSACPLPSWHQHTSSSPCSGLRAGAAPEPQHSLPQQRVGQPQLGRTVAGG